MTSSTMSPRVGGGPVAVSAGKGDYIYFRQPNGDVTFADAGYGMHGGGFEKMKRQNEGWTPLEQYGRFNVNHHTLGRPFEVLFQRGGAKELSIKQIEAEGFDLRPPLVPVCGQAMASDRHVNHDPTCWQGAQPVHFPQLDGREPRPQPVCEFCDDDDPKNWYPSQKALSQHIKVMHKDVLQQVALGDQIAKSITSSLDRMGVAKPIARCGQCSDVFDDINEFAAHVGRHASVAPRRGRPPTIRAQGAEEMTDA